MRSRKFFYIILSLIAILALVIQIIQISQNDFTASYLSQHDEYWTLYYTKPWTRIHCYLIGLIFGCNYFTYKYERDPEGNEKAPSKLSKLFNAMKEDNRVMLICEILGITIMIIMIALAQ